MAVNIEGVKGYEYQYKVTALVALLPKIVKVELFVEKRGGEDSLLKIRQNNTDKEIEIQVKRENNLLDTSTLVDWLCHFQEYSSNNNLLSRLVHNKRMIALFVTHSRCSDDTVLFKNEIQSIMTHQSLKISKKIESDFILNLTTKSFGTTELKKKREEFCRIQAKDIKSKNILPSILERVLIWEEFSDVKVDNEVLRILNTDYKIAQSKTNSVYLNILEIVKKGRDTSENILPEIEKNLIENRIGRPLIDNDYISRNEEIELIDHLEKNNVLLLTGISQCGKSDLAKKTAIYYYEKGYEYLITDDLDEARRFLLSNATDNKIAILEDPWGHITPAEDFEEKIRKIESLTRNTQFHHKLIITCKIEILVDIFNAESIDKCKINNLPWYDLTLKESSKLNEYWIHFAAIKSLPKEVVILVSNNISNSSYQHILQIGQLRYLANEEITNLTNKSFHVLEHIARRNSNEIAKSLQQYNDYYAEVLSVLAICATAIHPISTIDLAYVLSNSTGKPSITNKDFFTSTFNDPQPDLPSYPEDYQLSTESLKAIEYLEERKLINVSHNEIAFTHPNYYEAGRYLFFTTSQIKQKRIIAYLGKCISCLSPQNSYLGTKQLPFFYSGIRKSLQDEIIELALDSLNSIFPAVEDNSLIFLMNLIETVKEEQAQEIIRYIQTGGTSTSNIHWSKRTIPFISNAGGLNNLFFKVDSQSAAEAEIELLNRRLPNPYQGWMYIKSLKINLEVHPFIFETLLQYNEAFIRKTVVYEVFKRLDQSYKVIVVNIFADEHPSVVFNAIRASFINWFSYTGELKDFLLNLIKNSLNRRQVSIRAYNLISTFSIDYGHEAVFNWGDFTEEQKKEMWGVWGELYPITIQNVPSQVFMNTARFYSTMNEAIQYLEISVGIKVLNTWFERIDYQIQIGLILDEFELGVAEELMQLTKKDFNIRKDLFTRLINYNDTSFILVNLNSIIRHWDNLDLTEKNQIISLIYSDRIDIRWIKAGLLNSNVPPDEIVFHILGENGLLDKELDYILHKFPKQLLRDCLSLYCGFPQPLWWLGTHHRNRVFWDKVIRNILQKETHPDFDICLQEFLSDGVNGFSDRWSDGIELWREICHQTREKEILVESLTFNTAQTTCNITIANKLWEILINSYSIIDKENEIINLIADNIELLQQTGHKEDLFEILGKNFLLKKIMLQLKPDYIIINLLRNFKTNPFIPDKDKIDIISAIVAHSRDKTIRFYGTFNYFKSLKDEINIPNDIKDVLLKLPDMIEKIGKEIKNKKAQRFEYKLDDWIGEH